MATNNYSDIETPNFSFFGGETILEQLRANLIRDTEDVANSKLVLANAAQQTITTPLIMQPSDGDPEDNTTSTSNLDRPATRRWCRNAMLSNVISPYIENTAFTLSQPFVFQGTDILRINSDPTLANTVCRKSYVDTGDTDAKNLAKTELLAASNIWTGTQNQFTNNVVCNGTPSASAHLTTKSYVDTQLATKQNTITDGSLTIARTSGLQTALDSKAATTYVDTQLATKQNTITDASLTIARTSGLQAALDAKAATSYVDTQLAAKADITYVDTQLNNLIDGAPTLLNTLNEIAAALGDDPNFAASLTTALSQKQNIIQDGDLTIAKTANLSSTLTTLQTNIDAKQDIIHSGDLTIAMTSGLQTNLDSLASDITTNANNISSVQSDVSSLQTSLTGKQDTIVDNSLAISHVANLQSSLTSLASDITSNTNTINSVSSSVSTNTTAIASLETNKQNTIGANDLLISYVDGLQTALDAKQNTIGANDLLISYVDGLQTALDAKQDTIGANDLQISYVSGLQTALDAKQNTIGANDLQISYVSGLQTALDAKQDTIGANDLQISYVSGLQTALDNANSSISAAVADITTLENTVANVQTTVSAHSTSIATLETTVAGLSSSSAPTNMVTTDTTQTISADKTFSGSITFNNAIAIPDASVAQSKVTGLATSLAAKQDTLNSSSAITVASINGVSSTTLGYLDATSSIQTQLNGKQATLTTGSVSDSLLSSVFVKPSTAPTLTGTNFSDIPQSAVTNLSTDLAGKQSALNSSSAITVASINGVSSTTLGYLDATSSIQTQLNGKQATLTNGSVSDSLLASTFVKPSTAPTLTGTNFSGIPTSAIIPGGNLSVGALTCTSEVDSGNLKANSFCETLAAVTTNSSNNYTMNYNSGSVQYLATAPTANFTLALHNCLASGTQTSVYSLVYVNSGKFYPSTVNVYSDAGTTSVPCTVIWLGGTPTISSATVSIVTISIIKMALGATTYAMASVANYY